MSPAVTSLHRGLLLLVLLCASSACTPFWQQSREDSQKRSLQLQQTQLQAMRFADEYSGAIADPVGQFVREATLTEDRLAALNWRLTQSTAAYTIASGPNPVVNALDMIVLATISRMVLEDEWVAERFGDRALPLLQTHRDLEQRAWTLVVGILKPDHVTQLHAIIDEWRALHPKVRNAAQVRFSDFAQATRAAVKDKNSSGGLLSFIGIDPFQSFDPAVREIEQTRALAERSIYYLQRAPALLDMEVERLSYELAMMPEVKKTLSDVDRISDAAQAIGDLSRSAPELVARERQAAIADLSNALSVQQQTLQRLLVQTREVLEVGAVTSQSVDTTIKSIDALVERVQRRTAPGSSPGTTKRPFDIMEYAETARQVTQTADEVNELLERLSGSGTNMQVLAKGTMEQVHQLTTRIVWMIAFLAFVICALVLATALTYRYVTQRYFR